MGGRQVNRKRGSATLFGLHIYIPFVTLYNAVNRSQSEPGPSAGFFGGKKGIKDTLLDLLFHSDAFIGNHDPDVFARYGLIKFAFDIGVGHIFGR